MTSARARYTGRDAAPDRAGTRPAATARMHRGEVFRPEDMSSARCGRTDLHGELLQADMGAARQARSGPLGCEYRRAGKWVTASARRRR
jgi:hypothetical protein